MGFTDATAVKLTLTGVVQIVKNTNFYFTRSIFNSLRLMS